MIPALLFVVTIVASAIVTVFYKGFTSLKPDKADTSLMLFWAVAPMAAAYAVLCCIGGWELNATTVITGVIAGVLNIVTIACLLKSMTCGSFTISVIIINVNFCIPILLSRIFLREYVSLFQLIGILVLVAVIVLMNIKSDDAPKKTGEAADGGQTNAEPLPQPDESALREGAATVPDTALPAKKNSIVFLLLALSACFGNGLLNFMIKLQQHYTPGKGENGFYFVMYATAAVVGIAGYGIFRILRGKTIAPHAPFRKSVLLGLCVGLCTVASLYPQSFLPRYVSAPVQFTVTAAGAVLLSIVIGFVRYREKPTVRNIVSSVCCLGAILLQIFT